MLQCFIGTFDQFGLRSLRLDDGSGTPVPAADTRARFWAILDSEELPIVRRALVAGERATALEIIAERAHSIGQAE